MKTNPNLFKNTNLKVKLSKCFTFLLTVFSILDINSRYDFVAVEGHSEIVSVVGDTFLRRAEQKGRSYECPTNLSRDTI